MGNGLNNVITGLNGNDTVIGCTGDDMLKGNADTFVLNRTLGADWIGTFISSLGKIVVVSTTFGIGDGDTVLENAVQTTTGGWSCSNEPVLFSNNLPGLSATNMAAVAGAARGPVVIGPVVIGENSIMVMEDGFNSQVHLFTTQNSDGFVSESEVVLLAPMVSCPFSVLSYSVFTL